MFWEVEIRADPRHWEILLAKMKLDGAKKLDSASTKPVATPAVKVQEWIPQMFARFDKERTSYFRSATMRASYMSSVTEDQARFMSKSSEEVCSIPDQAQIFRDLVGRTFASQFGTKRCDSAT